MKSMKNLYALLVVAAMVVFSACTSSQDEPERPKPNEPTPSEEKMVIKIATSIAESRATDTAFEEGDKVGLYVVNYADGTAQELTSSGNHADNVCYTYISGAWVAANEIYWADKETHADFYLYYPYQKTIANVKSVSVKAAADQSTEAAYRAADILVGISKNVAPSQSEVSIVANHVMSQMIIKVAAGNGFTPEALKDAKVSVKVNNIKTAGTLNLATAAVTASGTATSITPWKDGDSYRAIIIPQSVDECSLITVTVDGRDYNLKNAFYFNSGKIHRFTVTLSKTSNGINVNIGNWSDDGVDNGGVAE